MNAHYFHFTIHVVTSLPISCMSVVISYSKPDHDLHVLLDLRDYIEFMHHIILLLLHFVMYYDSFI